MKNFLKKSILVWLVATFISFFFVAQSYFYLVTVGKEIQIFEELIYELCYYYSWALLLLLMLPLASRFRIEKKTFHKNLPIHILFAFIIAIVHRSVSFAAYIYLLEPGKLLGGTPIWLNPKILGGAFNSFINYWVIIGLYYGINYFRQYREQKFLSTQLEAELANAQLQALRMQLQPHFLFNTLHAVSALMDEDINKARKTLTLLSNLLRQSLDNIGKQFITLREELDFLKSYLEIEKTRFEERLNLEYKIDDMALAISIPNLLLQPLVENAIKHGIAPKALGGTIIISAYLKNSFLVLSVKDNGEGSNHKNGNGIGLTNIQKRLEKLYATNFSFIIKRENGFEVIISIPLTKEDNLHN